MPKISEDVIRAVTDAAKIEDVVGDFVTLRKAGVNMTGICPFHDDKHDGNFIVRPSTISEDSRQYLSMLRVRCESWSGAIPDECGAHVVSRCYSLFGEEI
jgi:hypothetical protein